MPSSLSILIPTLHRRESLLTTLELLAAGSAEGNVEIVVIDNAPQPEIREEDIAPYGRKVIRVLHAPTPGKGHALNLAVANSQGDVIAVLDDDMSPAPGWIDAVIDAVDQRPNFDIFSGRSYLIWPDGLERPAWTYHPYATGMAFSVFDPGDQRDREMGQGVLRFPSGNHYWFRRRVLQSVPVFPNIWAVDACFVSAARTLGHRGVFVPEVNCGHRIQSGLVDVHRFLKRAHDRGFVGAWIDRGMDRLQGHPSPSWLSTLSRSAKAVAYRGMIHATDLYAYVLPEEKAVPMRALARLRSGKCEGLLGPSPLDDWLSRWS
ncbi:glycosyltransferase family A protein [Aeoliella sp.]|uniref:glycosyltransferase family A protein n=1 Tax=Aeoliella sp. TaxID=2795800 RepID=UPI003CCBD62B